MLAEVYDRVATLLVMLLTLHAGMAIVEAFRLHDLVSGGRSSYQQRHLPTDAGTNPSATCCSMCKQLCQYRRRR